MFSYFSVADVKPSISNYQSLYQSHQGSAVLAALSSPPPTLLNVSSLASSLTSPLNPYYRTSQDLDLQLYKTDQSSLQSYKIDQSSALKQQLEQTVMIKQEPDQSYFTKSPFEHSSLSQILGAKVEQQILMKTSPAPELFEPSPPKAVPVSVENSPPDLRESTPDNDDIVQLKPAMSVGQS